jgi:superfamily II DNA helicase RecQ
MKIRESNGTFKVTITSLAGQELAIYREVSGGLTFELREVEEVNALEKADAFELERVPMFRAEEQEAVAAQEEVIKEEAIQKEVAANSFEKEYDQNNTLFHRLSDLRRQLASAENVPPYMIFHDKTLWGMVEKMPVNLSALGSISGVGKAKLEKYGVKFLSVLKEGA